jgi:hypothetical protein
MWKAVLAGTTALVIAGAAVAQAQPQRDGRQDGGRRFQPTIEDMRAFADARLAALRAGLTLTAEQQKHWPAFEQAARTLQKLRIDRIAAMRAARRDGQARTRDPVERMRQRAARLSETGAALKGFADAMGPLYASLDDAQKRRFAILRRMTGPRLGPGQRFRRGPQMHGPQMHGPRPGAGPDRRRTEFAPRGMTYAAVATIRSATLADAAHAHTSVAIDGAPGAAGMAATEAFPANGFNAAAVAHEIGRSAPVEGLR